MGSEHGLLFLSQAIPQHMSVRTVLLIKRSLLNRCLQLHIIKQFALLPPGFLTERRKGCVVAHLSVLHEMIASLRCEPKFACRLELYIAAKSQIEVGIFVLAARPGCMVIDDSLMSVLHHARDVL